MPTIHELAIEPLTEEAFAPFGQIISTKERAPDFRTESGTEGWAVDFRSGRPLVMVPHKAEPVDRHTVNVITKVPDPIVLNRFNGFGMRMVSPKLYSEHPTAFLQNNANGTVVPIGGHFVMDPVDAAYATREMIKPKFSVPFHYGTFPVLKGTPAEYQQALGQGSAHVFPISPGDKLTF